MPKIGLRNFHYAELTSDTESGVIYDEPVSVPGIQKADLNPNMSVDTCFADDAPSDVATTLGKITLGLTMADFPTKDKAFLLGHTVNTNGEMVSKSTDTPPYVAIMFECARSDGGIEYIKLLKGKFSEGQLQAQTKEDKINFVSDTMTGNFMKRLHDDQWKRTIISTDSGVNAIVIQDWYTSVEVESAT